MILLDRVGEFMSECGERVKEYVVSLMDRESGGFYGDLSELEMDVRFSYCAVSLLKLGDSLDRIDVARAREFVTQCQNYDGSFGGLPMMESHGAYVWCAVASLAILDALPLIDSDSLADWLQQRQTLKGGFNGRPEKLPDVCYSWWVYAALIIIR